MRVTVGDCAKALGYDYDDLQVVSPREVSYCDGAVLVRGRDFATDNPRWAFARILELFESPRPLIHPTAVIEDCVLVCPGGRIGAGSVIGSYGFGYEGGQRIPHVGGVIISCDVEIGANCCIDRGTTGDTVIGANTKLDNLVHVAHNVQIGRDCLIAACAEISGSVKIGDGVWIGPNASVANGVSIGDGAYIGIGSRVNHSVAAGQRFVR